jgi:hypothetical protein
MNTPFPPLEPSGLRFVDQPEPWQEARMEEGTLPPKEIHETLARDHAESPGVIPNERMFFGRSKFRTGSSKSFPTVTY